MSKVISERVFRFRVKPAGLVRYMVPQSVEAGAVRDAVSMYFRVSSPTENVIISAACGDTVLMQKKKKFVTPGEIESIKISADKLNALHSGEIIVRVDKVQEEEA